MFASNDLQPRWCCGIYFARGFDSRGGSKVSNIWMDNLRILSPKNRIGIYWWLTQDKSLSSTLVKLGLARSCWTLRRCFKVLCRKINRIWRHIWMNSWLYLGFKLLTAIFFWWRFSFGWWRGCWLSSMSKLVLQAFFKMQSNLFHHWYDQMNG